jgi:hypothetical protein
MARRARGLVAGLLVGLSGSGCLDAVLLPDPFEAEVKTRILVADPSGAEPVVVVEGADEPLGLRAWPAGDEVLVLGFAATPEILQVPRGRLALAGAGPRALPPPDAARRGAQVDGGWRWSDVAVDPALLARIRLPALEPQACLEAGGCLAGEGEGITCAAACPAVAVAPPAAPARSCPATWVPDERGVCRPVPPPEAPCEAGLRYDDAAQGCLPIAACPPGDFFVPEDAVDPVYVRAGATGGDGTEARPLGDLGEAWAVAQGRTLLLGPGTYDVAAGDPRFFRPGRAVGACPERTLIRTTGGWGVAVGPFELSRVRVEPTVPGETVLLFATSARLDEVEVRHLEGVGISVAGSTLTVSRSVVRATGSRETVAFTASGARLEVDDSTVVAWRAVVGYRGSRLSVQDSLLFGRPGRIDHVVMCILCEDLALRRTAFRFSNANAVNVVGPEHVTLEDVSIYGVLGDGIKVSACQLEFHCDETGACPEHCGPTPEPYTTVHARRLYVQDTDQGSGAVGDGVRMIIEDSAFSGMATRAIDMSSPPGHQTRLELRRVWADTCLAGVLRVSGQKGPAGVVVEDLIAFGSERVRFERGGVLSLENAEAKMSRVEVIGADYFGIYAICGETELEDVRVRGAGESGVVLVPNQLATVQRLAVEGAAGAGLLVDGALRLTNVQSCLEGRPVTEGAVAATDVQVEAAEGARGGIAVAGGSALEVARFAARGGQEGLRIQGISAGRFTSGRVEGAQTGLLLAPSQIITQVVQNVSIAGAETPVLRE